MRTVVQVHGRDKYERTMVLRRMFTSVQLADTIINEARRICTGLDPETNIFNLLPVRAATSIEYKPGAKKALVWNADGEKVRIDLPLEDGWRISDGNPFGIPNGPKTTKEDPRAFYFMRAREADYYGPVGFGGTDGLRFSTECVRLFYACDVLPVEAGVASVYPVIADHQGLIEDAAHLRQMHPPQENFNSSQALIYFVKTIFDRVRASFGSHNK